MIVYNCGTQHRTEHYSSDNVPADYHHSSVVSVGEEEDDLSDELLYAALECCDCISVSFISR